MKKNLKRVFNFIVAVMILTPFISVSAKGGTTFGTKGATISGTNYEIVVASKKIVLSSNANVTLSGDAEDYYIDVKENAKNVTITLSDYTAVTGGWVNAINLNTGSSVKVILVGDNTLRSGDEASAIRVPAGSALIIDGTGKLNASIYSDGASASGAVIGSAYDLDCGDITINGGTIKTEYEGYGLPTGIGNGDWDFQDEDAKGNIVINGGVIDTYIIGSPEGGNNYNVSGSGSAIIYTHDQNGDFSKFNGLIYNDNDLTFRTYGNAILTHDLTIKNIQTLVIETDTSITVSKGVTLTNNGDIQNNGSIMNNGAIKNEGTIINNGRVNSNTKIEGIDDNDINPASYDFIAGSEPVFTKGKDKEVVFKIDANFNLFVDGGKVFVNGELLDSEDYTANTGSTIITLSKKYLESLSNGNYELRVEFNNGAVSTTTFTVVDPTLVNPNTYDNIMVYVALLGLSFVGLIGMHNRLKKSL